MTIRYQFALADGDRDWTGGNHDFDVVWEHAFDHLRFHRGQGFQIKEKPDGDLGPIRKLKAEIPTHLKERLDKDPRDSVFVVRSVADGFALIFRRHEFADPLAAQQEQVARELIGTPYVFGFHDCSWLTLHTVNLVVPSILLPHKAGALGMPSQLHDPRVVHISRAQIKPMDLLFHWGDQDECDHVSLFLDSKGPGGNGRVLDTEPHDTGAPSGWPTGMLGTGVRVRPMNPGYYCDWAHVVAIGRIPQINGNP